jgi:HTH-type transcriptional regulator / antitoxin HigA
MNKVQKTAYQPDYVSPPGETLQETLDMLGMSQSELAERTGRPKKTINEIIQGKAAITPETALQLELVLRVPATFWLSRESRYRAWLARQEEDIRIDNDLAFLSQLPIKQMSNYGWLPVCKDKRGQAKSALSYFGVVSSDKVPLVEEAAFRRSQSFGTNPWALAAWLRKGELDAQGVTTESYDREAFLQAIQKIRRLTNETPATFIPALQKLCAQAGVAVVFVKELPMTSVGGATRWLAPDRALIQLSLRYKTDDMLWFAFFHLCGHIYLEHAKRNVLLEGIYAEQNMTDTLDQREAAANKFAMDTLIPPQEMADFISQRSFTKDAIQSFAERVDVSPGIVVGRLQLEKKLDWNKFRTLKRTILWEECPTGSESARDS